MAESRDKSYTDGTWAGEIDDYLSALFAAESDALKIALEKNSAAGLPAHDVSPLQGRFLQLVILLTGARRVLEIGTLGGYSTIWMADALPPGGLIDTIEIDPGCAAVARANITAAGHGDRIRVCEGSGADVLPTLTGPYDLIFIDADKQNNPAYLDWSMKLARPGAVIIGDNIVRGGEVVDPSSPDERVQGVRTFLQKMAEDPRLTATALQTTGGKGWDGFVMAVVKG